MMQFVRFELNVVIDERLDHFCFPSYMLQSADMLTIQVSLRFCFTFFSFKVTTGVLFAKDHFLA